MPGFGRMQRTIASPAEVSGFGFFGGADVTMRFLPAEPNSGIAFRRTDLGAPPIPARIENVVTLPRRTGLEANGARVEMIEHAMAALAGLKIDNCLVELDAVEVPGMDGSCRDFCEAILAEGIVEQDQPAAILQLRHNDRTISDRGDSDIHSRPHVRRLQAVTYQLDYGRRSPIHPQIVSVELDPDTFVREVAYARTFVLEEEVEALKTMGFGQRVTAADLLVFNDEGVIDNQLRASDECARHKLLDCIGDFALIGCEIQGHCIAWRSGHRLNQEMVRTLQRSHHESLAALRQTAAGTAFKKERVA